MPLSDFSKKSGGLGGKSTKKEPAKKSFLGINLPNLPKIGPVDLPDLPSIGVTTDKHNPVTQIEDFVTGAAPGLIRLVQGGGKELASLQGHQKGFNKKDTPTLHALATSPVETVKTLNPADIPKIAKGDFAKSALGKRVKREGVLGTGLATLSDLSLAAGGLGAFGKAAGFGQLAKAAELEQLAGASSKAAGLGKVAEPTVLSEAATKAAGRGAIQGAVDLEKAAGQASEAAALRATTKGALPKITEKAVSVSKLGADLTNPAKPFQLAAKGAGKALGGAAELLGKTATGERAVGKVEGFIKYAGDKAKIADLYHRTVTAPSQEALFRRIERGESAEAIRAELSSRYPGAEEVYNRFTDDLAKREAGINATRPRGRVAETAGNLQKTIWSKTPAEWQVDVDAATTKLKDAKAAASGLPDGDPGYKAANKTVTEAKKEVDRLNAMRKMSMEEPILEPPPPEVAEQLAPKAEAAVDETTPHGPDFEEMAKFNKENTKALRNEFHTQIQDTFAPDINAESIVPNIKVDKGLKVDLGEELKARGYTAWDSNTGMELPHNKITPESSVLPNQVFDQVKRYSDFNRLAKENSSILRAYDSTTGKWKHTVLALSPRWHFGNVMGNLVMAAASGMGPIDIVKYGNEAMKALKAGTSPAELLASGFHFSEEALGALQAGMPEGFMEKMKHPIQTSYSMNQYVDDLNRTMIYLHKMDKGVSSQAAVGMALKAAGDFGRMTPFEKNVVRRVMPFYAWQKHITKLAFRLPLEDPARVAWTLHLAELGNENNPDAGAEGFNAGSVGIGGLRLDTSALNPFKSSLGVDTSVSRAGSAINPLASLALAAGTGRALRRGLQPVKTAENVEHFGEAPPPLMQRPAELGKYLLQQVPQVRQAQDLVAGETKTRLDTGELAKTQYPDEAKNRWQQLLGLVGIGVKPNLKGAESTKVTTKKPGKKTGSGGLGQFSK